MKDRNLYMLAELLFKATKVWYENGRICILLSDRKEIRFPVDLNDKLKKAATRNLQPANEQN
jgi:hypothetical protein